MHDNARDPRTVLQHQFCRRLKAEREQRGISLHQIAEQSKVAVSHFVNLERGDVSRWPAGIYRRQFFREYIKAVGLPPATLDDFIELFPSEEDLAASSEATPRPAAAARMADGLRLALASEWKVRPTFSRTRGVAAAVDLVLVLLLAAIASLVLQVSLGAAAGVVAVVYFSTSTVLFGRSVAMRQLSGGVSEPALDAPPGAHAPADGERRSGRDRRRRDRRRPAEIAVLWRRLLSPTWRLKLPRRGEAPWGKPGYVRHPGDSR